MTTISMLFISYTPWMWFALAVIFSIIEAETLGLTTIWCAISAMLLIPISLTSLPLKWQFLLFAFISVLLFFFTRPFAIKRLHVKKETTNADSLIGEKVLITKAISQFEKGQAKIHGMVWSAASADNSDIPLDSECIVEGIKGVTLIVKKL